MDMRLRPVENLRNPHRLTALQATRVLPPTTHKHAHFSAPLGPTIHKAGASGRAVGPMPLQIPCPARCLRVIYGSPWERRESPPNSIWTPTTCANLRNPAPHLAQHETRSTRWKPARSGRQNHGVPWSNARGGYFRRCECRNSLHPYVFDDLWCILRIPPGLEHSSTAGNKPIQNTFRWGVCIASKDVKVVVSISPLCCKSCPVYVCRVVYSSAVALVCGPSPTDRSYRAVFSSVYSRSQISESLLWRGTRACNAHVYMCASEVPRCRAFTCVVPPWSLHQDIGGIINAVDLKPAGDISPFALSLIDYHPEDCVQRLLPVTDVNQGKQILSCIIKRVIFVSCQSATLPDTHACAPTCWWHSLWSTPLVSTWFRCAAPAHQLLALKRVLRGLLSPVTVRREGTTSYFVYRRYIRHLTSKSGRGIFFEVRMPTKRRVLMPRPTRPARRGSNFFPRACRRTSWTAWPPCPTKSGATRSWCER